jgi:phage shock protein A
MRGLAVTKTACLVLAQARAASAKTSIAIQEMVGGLRSNSASAFAAFDKMEEKVGGWEGAGAGDSPLCVDAHVRHILRGL